MRSSNPASDDDIVAFTDLQRVTWHLLGLGMIGLVATARYVWMHGGGTTLAILWSLAIFAVAMGVGFLFAVPKVLQAPPAKPPAGTAPAAAEPGDPGYRQLVNTNLEEISDWLTKIIVGTTLIHLKQVPDLVNRLAVTAVRDLPKPDTHQGLGTAIVLFFAAVGGLFGYLVTRLYIQGAFARAEGQIGAEVRRRSRELEEKVRETTITLPLAAAPAPPARDAAPDRAPLIRAADDYLAISVPDWAERTRAKDQAGNAMAVLASELGVAKSWLASQGHEGLLLTLAAYVQSDPQPGDAALLLDAAPKVHRLHVRYRFLLAFSVLIKKELLAPGERAGVRNVLGRFETGADASLLKIIQAVRERLAAVEEGR